MKVRNFIYNGMFVNELPGFADYSAEFVEWSKDPGMALMNCSDGKQRLIPSFCVDEDLPTQTGHTIASDENPIVVGQPSSSQ